jgi:toxin secretion/phage lysis holin
MKEVWNSIRVALSAIGGWLGYILGGLDGLLYALIAFTAIDYVTGVMCAITDRKLSSEIGFKGIFKKIITFMLVAVGHIIDQRLIGSGNAFRTAIICFYISNEGISILENAARIGLPVPKKLKEILQQLHCKENDNDENKPRK